MKFYSHRSVEDQANRLPLELRERYRQTQLDRIEIDGEVITGYFEYSFLEEKSYKTQPIRSDDGTINDLDSYSTFLTPRLIIRYNMMDIDDYRKLMKKLKTKNAFMVTCYDIVEDKRVTHEMYFATPPMPIIYQQYLMTLGIQEYTIELIGTNRKPLYNIYYDFNLPPQNTLSFTLTEPYFENQAMLNANYLVGNIYVDELDETLEYLLESDGYILRGWNTKKDGTGFMYKDSTRYYMSKDIVLYAQWEFN